MKKIRKLMMFKLLVCANLFFLIVSGCKKYPENTIWFPKKKTYLFFYIHKLTAYKVDGVDSLESLNKYFGSNSEYNNISRCTFLYRFEKGEVLKDSAIFSCGYKSSKQGNAVKYIYSKNKKEIKFIYGNNGVFDTTMYSKNIFIDDGWWKIIQLDKNWYGNESKRIIKRTYNGKNYELEFSGHP